MAVEAAKYAIELTKRTLEERMRVYRETGLHYCSNYNNLVKFNEDYCPKCPYNGLR